MCDEQAALAGLFVLAHYVSVLFPDDHSVVCRQTVKVDRKRSLMIAAR
jgi:hypothetical protein